MSLLESFADALLMIATTHHGELKTLKYNNDTIENACMEFDEVNLRPTYKILWGVPGHSNAINIAERLGLPDVVVNYTREQYGTASAEIYEEIERIQPRLKGRKVKSTQALWPEITSSVHSSAHIVSSEMSMEWIER
ncbi:Endonuclease muts2 [Thalictrum thalictroides]|uniref:Endonuclease muts2 n=1 Tax=Thalictrum thalictroides TaxID=46969 RepID=A0A7J6XEQ9_THATH|nr:Endonuclease muts2 [Thalictrum thalictroides]